jgi:cytochrome P450
VRRMRLLTERVEQITADHLDAMEEAGPPADLVTAFATPIPAVVICELLGVPYQDRGSFQKQVESFMNGETSDEDLKAAHRQRPDAGRTAGTWPSAHPPHLSPRVQARWARPVDVVISPDVTAGRRPGRRSRGRGPATAAAGRREYQRS